MAARSTVSPGNRFHYGKTLSLNELVYTKTRMALPAEVIGFIRNPETGFHPRLTMCKAETSLVPQVSIS
jgi:hypothetical protein